MKQLLTILFITFSIIACDKDDDYVEPIYPSTSDSTVVDTTIVDTTGIDTTGMDTTVIKPIDTTFYYLTKFNWLHYKTTTSATDSTILADFYNFSSTSDSLIINNDSSFTYQYQSGIIVIPSGFYSITVIDTTEMIIRSSNEFKYFIKQ